MPTIYVRSTNGSSSDGTTWALAKLDLAGAAAIDAAGDTIYVSDAHAESTNAAISATFAGTFASPTKIICGDDAAEPPTAVATTATVETSGSSQSITMGLPNSGALYVRGITYNVGGVATAGISNFNSGATFGITHYHNCTIYLRCTSGSARLAFNAAGQKSYLENVTLKFAATGQGFDLGGVFIWRGGSIASGGSAITVLIREMTSGLNRGGTALIEGVDLSQGASTMQIARVDSTNMPGTGVITLRNCKMPSSWNPTTLGNGTWGQAGGRITLQNCAAGDTNYDLWVEDYSGSIIHETTYVRTGGASDGTTSFSWKMVTGANAEYPVVVLRSPELKRWNETTGSEITVTIEIEHASQGSGTGSRFTNAEIWLEVQYLGTSGFPLSLFASDGPSDVLATPTDQTDSSETWGGALGSAVKQKLSVPFTPQEKGMIIATVCMAGASDTCYVDPKITVS